MSSSNGAVLAVPTNIITGFLGVGKTSSILSLLEDKPADERWAVLVNEFGEIGVDRSIVQGSSGEDDGVYVREVPGGCMCCAAGLPMQIALTQLLRKAKPHRLLIEPTGLGHPVEVLQTLSSDYNKDVLSLQKTITLVDPRQVSDERYTHHDTFRQQLSIADVVVANKSDVYSDEDYERLLDFVGTLCAPETPVVRAEQGRFDPNHLNGETRAHMPDVHTHDHDNDGVEIASMAELPLPSSGFLSAVNRGEGYESVGWRFSPTKIFDRSRLVILLSGLYVERAKGVFVTSDGTIALNKTGEGLSVTRIDDVLESRLEIIAPSVDATWEERVLACIESET